MYLKSIIALAGLMFSALPCTGQTTEEDVALLKDGTMFRGAITDPVTPGGTVILHRHDGNKSLLYWHEIVGVKRYPEGIPDSLIRLSLSEPGAVSPRVELHGYHDVEDVVFLQDTTLIRGVQLYLNMGGSAALWERGNARIVAPERILKSVTVSRGIPDSALIATYILLSEDRDNSNRRIFAIFGGAGIPLSGTGSTSASGTRSFATGLVVGAQAGIPITTGVRVLTTFSYSVLGRGVNPVLTEIEGVQDVKNNAKMLMLLAGVEVRVFGFTRNIFRGFAQAGMFSMSESGYTAPIPLRLRHPSGSVTVDAIAASSPAFCLGVGGIFGRLEANLRWVTIHPRYTTTTTIMFDGVGAQTVEAPENDPVNVMYLELGVNLF
jgi:hypothetical protein